MRYEVFGVVNMTNIIFWEWYRVVWYMFLKSSATKKKIPHYMSFILMLTATFFQTFYCTTRITNLINLYFIG
jgi:uncharacterized membrane protein YidH (DUF202 family)